MYMYVMVKWLWSTARPRANYDLTLAALGKNVKKQQEVSDLNQD